ncbi:MAG TPA: adenylate/guanylate cyclase domain-containing protein [Candidatus Limnocylindrales bacterium]|nr:adenylate/guanylate cyclase domain-containing protein [Candidatus Limnocylindrales bacterium]
MGYSRQEAAERAGVDVAMLDRLIDLGILELAEPDQVTAADVRRAQLAKSLEEAGIPLDGVARAVKRGALSFAFLDAAAYDRFGAFGSETFRQVCVRTGVPIELLSLVREVTGSPEPSPDDRLREDEMAIVPFLELQVRAGFRQIAIERLLRVYGESTRRLAESEGAWWNSEIVEPAVASGADPDELAAPDFADRSVPLAEATVLAMYHVQQARTWIANFTEGFEGLLAKAGIRARLERPPAICFLDITGYTRLTQERGDDAAAALAETLARLVQRSSVRHGGKPIKWLGDGVMFHFRDPGPGIRAALEMVEGVAASGLPPAHVGLHSGPVLFQQGDYFGQTVNITSRIADYARPGEVLVSEAAAEAAEGIGVAFDDVGAVELKGVGEPVHLYRALLS